MTLRFANAPRNGDSLVRDGLNRVTARKSPLSEALALRAPAAVATPSLQVREPHAVFDLRADEIAEGKGLASAHATGFRYPVEDPGGPLAAAEVLVDQAGTAKTLANINQGPFVKASDDAFKALDQMPQVRGGNFEARLLRFSAIYLVAIWLKAEGGGDDLIYPLAPAPSPLTANKLYDVRSFLAAIVPLAQQKLAPGQP